MSQTCQQKLEIFGEIKKGIGVVAENYQKQVQESDPERIELKKQILMKEQRFKVESEADPKEERETQMEKELNLKGYGENPGWEGKNWKRGKQEENKRVPNLKDQNTASQLLQRERDTVDRELLVLVAQRERERERGQR